MKKAGCGHKARAQAALVLKFGEINLTSGISRTITPIVGEVITVAEGGFLSVRAINIQTRINGPSLRTLRVVGTWRWKEGKRIVFPKEKIAEGIGHGVCTEAETHPIAQPKAPIDVSAESSTKFADSVTLIIYRKYTNCEVVSTQLAAM
jgi:hypothetical protein